MKNKSLFSVLLLILVGCANPGYRLPQKVMQVSYGMPSMQELPELGKEVSAELGDSLISKAYSVSTPAIRLNKEITHQTSNNGVKVVFTVAPEVMKQVGKDSEGAYYASNHFVFSGPLISAEINRGGIFIPNDSANNPASLYWAPNNAQDVFIDQPEEKIDFQVVPNIVENSSSSFKRELVYNGVSKNVIPILYREFSNDLARPAFSQDLKYDLGEGRVIGFKGARFEVIKATNTQISYKVLKQLD